MRNVLLEQVRGFLQNLNIQWAVCGGYALDLFLNRETRKHSDIDICVFEKDRQKIINYMVLNGWRVYQFLGQGKVQLLNVEGKSDPGRNLMCVKDGCNLVKFYPCEEDGVLLHEFYHTGIEHLNYLEFLFNYEQENSFIFDQGRNLTREMQNAILYRNGCPYIAPELALLYKSARADHPENQYDYGITIPHLNDEQLSWLHKGLEKLYPQGHPWSQK